MKRSFQLSIFILLGYVLFSSCNEEKIFVVEILDNPFPESSMFPNFNANEDEVILSYIHSVGDTLDELMISTFDGQAFSKPIKVTEGKDWFVNWADFPAVAKNGENILISWLEMSAEGTYDYNINMSISNDNGNSWNEPFIPHKDSVSAEHGFVSIIPYQDGFMAAWLDGRNTKLKDENGKEIYGQMTLRSAVIMPDGTMSYELEVDDKICDCCQTDLVNSSKGPVLVYRNRAEGEIRDNYFSIFNGDSWSEGKPIHNDVWEIAGCPVNGPAIDAIGENIVSAWYTQALSKPRVIAAILDKEEGKFKNIIKVADEKVLGRVDIKYLNDEKFMVTYMTEAPGNKGVIKGNIYDNDLTLLQELELGVTVANRSSGFPRTVRAGDDVLVIYTEIGSKYNLITKKITI